MKRKKRRYPPPPTRTPEEALGEARRNTRKMDHLRRKMREYFRLLRGEE